MQKPHQHSEFAITQRLAQKQDQKNSWVQDEELNLEISVRILLLIYQNRKALAYSAVAYRLSPRHRHPLGKHRSVQVSVPC